MFDLKSLLKTQMIHYAIKCRIYPMDDQKVFFKKQFGCCRFIYNYLLIRMEKAYKRRKEPTSIYQAKKFISPLKATTRYSFLKDVNSQSLQASVFNLGHAREKFFKSNGGYPRLKKKAGKQSFEVPQNFLLKQSKRKNNFLLIPKMKSGIKIKIHREIKGIVRHLVISIEPDGKYYASLNCLREEYCVILFDPKKEEQTTANDLGFADLLVNEYGVKIKVPRFLRKSEGQLTKAQRNHSNKKKDSANKEKARLKVAKIHSKIRNKRKDFTHKQSNKLVNENQVLYFETLNIKGMMQNHCLAKSASYAMLGEFVRQVKYKARWRNKIVIQIGRFEPSSKLCSNCGTKNDKLKLHHRVWRCKTCNVLHDRDINAAKNIKKIGQGMPEYTPVERSASICLLERRQISWLAMKEAGSES